MLSLWWRRVDKICFCFTEAQLISKKVVAVNAWETTFTGYSPSPQRMKGETGEEEAQLWQQYPNQNYLDDLNNLVQSSAPSTPLASDGNSWKNMTQICIAVRVFMAKWFELRQIWFSGAAFSFDFMDAWRKTQASYPQWWTSQRCYDPLPGVVRASKYHRSS